MDAVADGFDVIRVAQFDALALDREVLVILNEHTAVWVSTLKAIDDKIFEHRLQLMPTMTASREGMVSRNMDPKWISCYALYYGGAAFERTRLRLA